MRTVWKYQAAVQDNVVFEVPGYQGVCLLEVLAPQTLTFWVSADPDEPAEPVPFRVTGTGRPAPGFSAHVASVLDGPFVWHVFEEKR